MKTAQLQSLKAQTKQQINSLSDDIKASKSEIKFILQTIRLQQKTLAKKVDQQRQIKADISASKTPRAPGSRRKHNKTDPRYVAWYTAQHAARNDGVIDGAASLAVVVEKAESCAC